MADEKFIDIASNAKQASKKLATLSTEIKNKALLAIAQAFENNTSVIFEANKKDLQEAQILVENGELSQSTFNRLKLD